MQARADSARQAIRDTLQSAKKQVAQAARDEVARRLFGSGKDSTHTDTAARPGGSLKETGKGLLRDLNPFKRKG